MTTTESLKTQVVHSEWFKSLAKYEKPDLKKALGQVADTLIPYFALWALMVYMVHHHFSLLLLAPLLVLSAGLLVRVFIIMHDCGHGSFFASHKANRLLGQFCSLLVFTPYFEWRHHHAAHHAAAGDLDRRGMGDVYTMTVEEFKAAPKRKQIGYRLYRNPFMLFIIGPPLLFLIMQRTYDKGATTLEKRSVISTNIGIAIMVALGSWAFGLKTYLLIQLPIIIMAAMVGVWMFYLQHQYEKVYWAPHHEWDPIRAALEGSSYFSLPPILQWFSGNIGLHHIHHLRSRIANYNLQKCFDEVPELQNVEPLTLKTSFKCMRLNLWDESELKLVSFKVLKHSNKLRME